MGTRRRLLDESSKQTLMSDQGGMGRSAGPEVRQLRERRPQSLLDAVTGLDVATGATTIDLGAIAAELSEVFKDAFVQVPLGIVARCYLGPPFIVHYLDLMGNIIEHFSPIRPMPSPFEGARSLALHPAYLYVEVYDDFYLCVDQQGVTSRFEP